MTITDAAFARLAVLVRQLQGKAPRASGIVTVTWPGGVSEATAVVAHGLDAKPSVQAQSQDQTGVGTHATMLDVVDASSFTVRLFTPSFTPAAGTETPVAWWAY